MVSFMRNDFNKKGAFLERTPFSHIFTPILFEEKVISLAYVRDLLVKQVLCVLLCVMVHVISLAGLLFVILCQAQLFLPSLSRVFTSFVKMMANMCAWLVLPSLLPSICDFHHISITN